MVRRFIFDVEEGVTRMLPTLPPWNFKMRSSTMNCSTIWGMPIPPDGGRLVRENEILFRRLGAKIPVKAQGIVGRPCRNAAAGRQDAHPHNVRKVEQKRKGSDEKGEQQDASPKDGD